MTAPSPANTKTWWIDIVFLCVVLGVLFFTLLGVRPLFVPDEGRYAEIAREMVVRSDYVTPYLNGVKYFEKPILFYWLGAAAIKIGGVNLWSVRAINAVLGLLGCLLTYITARKLYDRCTGLLAALLLATSALYFTMTHMVSLDLPVTVFLTCGFYAFLLGTQTTYDRARRWLIWSAFVAAGLAVLTKGLIGILFPLLVVGAWITVCHEWRLLPRLYLPSSIILFLAVTVPWHWLVGTRHPEFFYFYFIEQHFLRYTTPDVGHYQPAWFFLPVLVAGFFPWIAFLPQALVKHLPTSWTACRARKVDVFLLLWALLIFTFFSFSKSKLIPYILPVLPPLAILTAHYLAAAWQQKVTRPLRAGFYVLLVLALVFNAVAFLFTQHTLLPDTAVARIYLFSAGTVLLLGYLFSLFSVYWKPKRALVSTLITTGLFLILFIGAVPSIDTRSILPIASQLKNMLRPTDEVICFNQYYQDLPFYLERRVTILNWKNELTYGMAHQDTHEWMIDTRTFWKRFQSKQRVFVIMSQDEFVNVQNNYPNERFYVLKKTINNVLISNQAVSD
jgi:4-amino-4-deoxy-L-arabinose transferase-like glycosyltransferase